MQPNISWAGFRQRPAADLPPGASLEDQLHASIERVHGANAAPGKPGRKPRTPAVAAPVAAPALADALMVAIRLASARKGKQDRETAIRETTLLEVLGELMKGAA